MATVGKRRDKRGDEGKKRNRPIHQAMDRRRRERNSDVAEADRDEPPEGRHTRGVWQPGKREVGGGVG